MKKKVLLFFTGSYPYGRQEAFIENEIGYLANAFDSVVILPQLSLPVAREVPANVMVRPLPEFSGIMKNWLIFKNALRTRVFWQGLHEVFAGRMFGYRIRTLASYVGLARIYRNFILERVVTDFGTETEYFLYSYWLDRNALAMVMLRQCLPVAKVLSRVHRFDVYEERNLDAYLPLRRPILSSIDAVVSISQDALVYLEERYPTLTRYELSRLGTIGGEYVNPGSESGNFYIISVSNVIPVKRVGMIADCVIEFARRSPQLQVRWTHFGDGPLFESLRSTTGQSIPPNLQIDLQGGQLNSVVKQYYRKYPIDIFLNLSESEGIPVSFMEAMSYAVPVMATMVGGVGEILNAECGYPLPADVSVDGVVKRLLELAANRHGLRELATRALSVWHQKYSADITYPEFCALLLDEVK